MSDDTPGGSGPPHPGTVSVRRGPADDAGRAHLLHALHDPRATGDAAREFARSLDDEPTPPHVIAHRAAAIALRDSGRGAEALDHALAAATAARELGDHVLEAEARYTLALCLATVGDGDRAAEHAEAAVRLARGHRLLHARTLVHRALVRQRLGRDDWQEDYEASLPVLVADGDGFWEALARLNRGPALVYQGRVERGIQDLLRVVELSEHPGVVSRDTAAFARHNLGFALSRAGRLPAALSAFEMAASQLVDAGIDPRVGVPDRAEALLLAGLTREAANLLEGHLRSSSDEDPLTHPEVMLLFARTVLTTSASAQARDVAADAVDLFTAQQRPGWALVARGMHALASLPLGEVDAAQAAGIADEVDAGGWPDVAAEVRAAAALRAAEDGDPGLARELLAPLDGRLDELPLAPQLETVRARMAIARHGRDNAAVLDGAADALERLEERRMLLGASELRAHVTRLAEDILTRATLAALELGDLDRALEWVDRARSQALDQPPVVPPEDEQLADDLGRLRVISDQLARKRAEGEAVTDLLVEKENLERRVRDRARTASGTRTDASTASAARQSGTTEIAYLDLGDHLAALVASDSGSRRVDLEVDRGTIDHELDALGFAMQRVGSARSPGRRRDLAARSLNHSLTTLDDALVAPLGLGPDDRVVVSPTSVLFDVPWSGLPGLVDRPVAVAPALRLSRRPPRGDAGTGTLLLEGPRLSHARAELDALADVVADPRTILGEEGTVAVAKQALPEVAIAHLACHGVFRADNPQFSSLELADGPMFVYDLESLPRVPELIVLSACQTGRSAVHVGDELLGVTASLLALGARTVVAALPDVPDDLSALLMLAFHQHVRAGASPAEALAHARRTLLASRDEPAARLTAAAFVCLGAP